jgi:hypothetical protein
MNRFAKYRVHFDVSKQFGLICAHSGVLTWDQFEEYKRIYGCGVAAPSPYTGDLYWEADPRGKDENSIRLAREFLEESGDEFPTTAARVRWMLMVSDEDHRHKQTGT